MLFKLVELPSDEPVQFVGVYALKWGRVNEPTVAFREATPEEIAAEQAAAPKLPPGTQYSDLCEHGIWVRDCWICRNGGR